MKAETVAWRYRYHEDGSWQLATRGTTQMGEWLKLYPGFTQERLVLRSDYESLEAELSEAKKDCDSAWEENEKVVGLFKGLTERAEKAEAELSRAKAVIQDLVRIKDAMDIGIMHDRPELLDAAWATARAIAEKE